MPISSIRSVLPLAALAALSACMAPSPIPAGYTYHRETYKSPPAPLADEIGYDFTVAANHKAVAMWEDIARDALSRLESGYTFQSRDVAIIPPLGIDQMNKSLDYALHKAFREKGYNLKSYSPDIPGVAVTMNPVSGQSKDYGLESRGDFATRHGLKEEDIKTVQIGFDVREGAALAYQQRAVYHIPAFGFEPEYNTENEFRLDGVVGKAPYRVAPELRPERIRPAAVTGRVPADEDKTAGQAGAPTSILKNDLDAPAVTDEANKPLDVQDEGFNE